MIGPLFRSPRRGPRSEPREPGTRRRTKNLLVDMLEYLIAPLGRWEQQRLVIETVEIAIADLGPAFDGYRIAFLTDLHTSPLVPRWWLERAVEQANALRPDLIALGGDFLDDDPHYIAALADILRPLRARDGLVGVLGNHDHYVGAQGVREELAEAAVRELRNTALVLERGGDRLAIAGVGDLEMDVVDVDAAMQGLPPDMPRVVLSHDPDVFGLWPADHRLDLMLAGHTHGGQAHLPLIGPPYVPSQFGSRYLRGLIREGERQVYVSRGVGASGVPFRWGCPAELSLVVLRSRHS